jgi:fructuronate reductase
MRYVYGEDEHGSAISVSDPLAREFAALASRHRGDPAAFARALFAIRAVFDEDLHNEPRFTVPVTRWLTNLFADGSAKTVAKAIAR